MQQFIYNSKHLPVLKKYKTIKLLFLFLGCLVLALQSICWLIVWVKNKPITNSDMIFVGITLASALYFVASQSMMIVRNKKMMNIVKDGGSVATMRVKMKFSKKSSFAGILVVFARILAILFVIALVGVIISFIQNYINWGKVILKMPFMVLCAVSMLNISAELRYQTMVEKVK